MNTGRSFLCSLLDLIGQFFAKTESKYKATKINVNLMHDNLPTADFYEQASSKRLISNLYVMTGILQAVDPEPLCVMKQWS